MLYTTIGTLIWIFNILYLISFNQLISVCLSSQCKIYTYISSWQFYSFSIGTFVIKDILKISKMLVYMAGAVIRGKESFTAI